MYQSRTKRYNQGWWERHFNGPSTPLLLDMRRQQGDPMDTKSKRDLCVTQSLIAEQELSGTEPTRGILEVLWGLEVHVGRRARCRWGVLVAAGVWSWFKQ